MNRNFGRLLAVIFGLTLFLEVACLPLISTFSLQVEKSMVAEVEELDEKEAEKAFDLFQFCAPAYLVEYFDVENCSEQFAKLQPEDAFVADSAPTFIKHRSLRI